MGVSLMVGLSGDFKSDYVGLTRIKSDQLGSNQEGGVNFRFVAEAIAIADAKEFAVEHAHDVTARFIGVAMRVELSLNIGAFGPLPEEGFGTDV